MNIPGNILPMPPRPPCCARRPPRPLLPGTLQWPLPLLKEWFNSQADALAEMAVERIAAGEGFYRLPDGGIPLLDLAEEVRTALAGKADGSAVYTKAETDAKVSAEAQARTAALASKADRATTLAGYGIGDAYTRAETDTAVSAAVSAEATARDTAISAAISAVRDSAPEAFDTLKEIADWIEDDETGTAALVARVTSLEAGKQDALTAQQLASIAAVPQKAAAADLRYRLVQPTPVYSEASLENIVTLVDRAINKVVVTPAVPSSGAWDDGDTTRNPPVWDAEAGVWLAPEIGGGWYSVWVGGGGGQGENATQVECDYDWGDSYSPVIASDIVMTSASAGQCEISIPELGISYAYCEVSKSDDDYNFSMPPSAQTNQVFFSGGSIYSPQSVPAAGASISGGVPSKQLVYTRTPGTPQSVARFKMPPEVGDRVRDFLVLLEMQGNALPLEWPASAGETIGITYLYEDGSSLPDVLDVSAAGLYLVSFTEVDEAKFMIASKKLDETII